MSDHEPRPVYRRRWFKTLVLVLAGFLLLMHVAGGWYFAGQIRSDALDPRLPSRDLGVHVLAVTETTITLDGADREGIEQSSTAGLWWPTGYGRLGEVLGTSGTATTRVFELQQGEVPPVCALDDETCDEADIESVTFRRDPADVGLDFEDVVYASPLGEMRAWLVEPPAGPAETWAVHVHGWRTDRRETLRMLPPYAAAGITSLVIEYRNDGAAPDDPSGFYRFGRTEWEDVEAAVDHALGSGATQIVLAGYSTGAAIDMALLERSSRADHVVGVVFDSPNIDFGRVVKHEASERSIPGTPIPLPPSLTATAMWLADLRYDIDWKSIDYTGRGGILTVPTLVFHGADDGSVPLDVAEALAERYPDLVDLVVTPRAAHVQSWNIDPDAYEAKLVEFLGSLG